MLDFSKIIQKLNSNSSNTGKTLLVLNASAMLFAALSNVFATVIDKNTSKEDKKFLVPASAVTGVANIGLYYLLTDKLTKKLGQIATTITNNMPVEELKNNAKKFVDIQIHNAEKKLFKNDENIKNMKSTLLKNGDVTEYAQDLYKQSVKSGISTLGAFIGAVIGCAVLTPIIRDVSAYFVQKKMEDKYPDLQQKPYRPYFDPAHIGEGKYKYMQNRPMSLRSYMLSTNGRTRV